MKNMLVVSKTCDAGRIQSSPLPHGCFVVTGKGEDHGFNLAITRLLEIGCEFFATWGDYSDAEEIIDDLILDAGDMDAVTISLNESLEDAVEFFAHGAFPGLNCVRFVSDRKSTRLNSSHLVISYAVFCLKKKQTRLLGARIAREHQNTLTPCRLHNHPN